MNSVSLRIEATSYRGKPMIEQCEYLLGRLDVSLENIIKELEQVHVHLVDAAFFLPDTEYFEYYTDLEKLNGYIPKLEYGIQPPIELEASLDVMDERIRARKANFLVNIALHMYRGRVEGNLERHAARANFDFRMPEPNISKAKEVAAYFDKMLPQLSNNLRSRFISCSPLPSTSTAQLSHNSIYNDASTTNNIFRLDVKGFDDQVKRAINRRIEGWFENTGLFDRLNCAYKLWYFPILKLSFEQHEDDGMDFLDWWAHIYAVADVELRIAPWQERVVFGKYSAMVPWRDSYFARRLLLVKPSEIENLLLLRLQSTPKASAIIDQRDG